jgi:tetratricopeptide (TPR) repeat protein
LSPENLTPSNAVDEGLLQADRDCIVASVKPPAGPLVLILALAACKPDPAKLPKDEDAPAAPATPNAERLLEEALQDSDGPSRAAKLRKAAAALANAKAPSELSLRAHVRAQQGLWEAASRDATAAILKGGSRRLRLQINGARLIDSFFALSPRQEYATLVQAQEDSEILGRADPELAALADLVAAAANIWDRPEPFDQDQVTQQLREALGKALDATDIDAAAPPLAARLADHLAALSPDDSADMASRAEAALARAPAGRAETRRARLFHAIVAGKREAAHREAMALAQFLPDSPEPLFILAQLQLGGGERDEAFKTLDRAAALAERPADPALWRALTRLGALDGLTLADLRPSEQDCLEALRDLREAAALDADDPVPAFYIGIVHLQFLQNFREGLEYLEKYNDAQPGTLLARNARLLIASFQGPVQNEEDAVGRFRRARYVTKELKNLDAGRQLYEMLLRQLDVDAAGANRVNESIRDHVATIARYNLACIHSQQGSVEEAFALLRQALEAGLRAFDQIETDPDLEALRRDPRFEPLLKKHKGE